LGNARFDSKTSEFYRQNIELIFFNHFLKDKGEMNLPEAYVFNTGANKWRTLDSWPPRNTETKTIYMDASGKLSFEAPASRDCFAEYVSDPAKPVPFINNTAIGMTREYMTDDQRFVATRPDVLVYRTDALSEDITIAGPIKVSLDVSTSGT